MASTNNTIVATPESFLDQHGLTAAEFANDSDSKRRYRNAYKEKIKELARTEANNRAIYGDNKLIAAQSVRSRNMLDSLYADKVKLDSIRNTMTAYQKDPTGFDNRLDASRSAESALSGEHYDRAGFATGALTGGVAGHGIASLAARVKKVNPKFFGPVGGVAGAVLGAGAGFGAGRFGNEKVTGRRYTEIKTPYEIAKGMNADGNH